MVFLAVWFITSLNWWRYSILSPLIIYSYQFWEAFQDVQIIEAYGNLRIMPLVILNVAIVLLISKLVKYRADLLEVYENVNVEMEEILQHLIKQPYKGVSDALKDLKKESGQTQKKFYRKKLKALERELTSKLGLDKV
jgi:hypothetical protein